MFTSSNKNKDKPTINSIAVPTVEQASIKVGSILKVPKGTAIDKVIDATSSDPALVLKPKDLITTVLEAIVNLRAAAEELKTTTDTINRFNEQIKYKLKEDENTNKPA